MLRGSPLFAAILVFLAFTQGAYSQGAQNPSAAQPDTRQLGAEFSYYYEKPFDIPAFLVAWENATGARGEGVVGLLAAIFIRQPAQIRVVTNAKIGQKAQLLVAAALRLAGKLPEAKNAAHQWGWPPERIATLTPLPMLGSTKPTQPGDFDVLWGASFATGDEASYVRPIFDYYASVAAQEGVDVQDIVTIVIARGGAEKEKVQTIAKKYPRETFQKVVFASSALWSLGSNAGQHKFVAAALARYLTAQPDSPAAKGFVELRAALAGRPR